MKRHYIRTLISISLRIVKSGLIAALVGLMTIPAGSAEAIVRGSETGLPLPRFVSLKTSKGNVRHGPSLSYQIDWVYLRRDLPLLIVAEHGHWRRVEDRDGRGGWMHYSLLSGRRTVLVESETVRLRVRPDLAAQEVAILERGVVARIDECTRTWCWLEKNGYEGWAPKTGLWGARAGELIE